MISIDIIDRDRNKTYKLDIPTDITIKEMSDRFCKIAGLGKQNVLYHFCGEILASIREYLIMVLKIWMLL